MDEELNKEFEKEFERIRKEMGFSVSLEKLDELFFFRDYVQKEGYVSSRLSKSLLSRIVAIFGMWEGYLHTMILPNPNNIPNNEESKMIDDDDRKQILRAMTAIRVFLSRNNLVSINPSVKEEAELFNESVRLWEGDCRHVFAKVIKKVNDGWVKSLSEPEEKIPKTQKKGYNFG